MAAGKVAQAMKAVLPAKPVERPSGSLPPGITVVIPSRNGKRLLETAMPGVERELEAIPSEVIIVDNGSSDGTAGSFPRAILEVSAEPLSFASAVDSTADSTIHSLMIASELLPRSRSVFS